MSTRRRTRFTVNVGDRIGEIFAARERVNGDLVVQLSRPAVRAVGNGSHYPMIEEMRVSAHVARNDFVTLIAYQTAWSDGSHTTCAANVSSRRGQLIWPVATQAVADLAGVHSVAEIRPDDSVISLGHHYPRWSLLLSSLVITTPGIDLAGLGPWNCVGQDFTHFRLSTLWNFTRVPSVQDGCIILCANSPMAIDGPGMPQSRIKDRSSSSRAELVSTLRESSIEAVDDHIERLRQQMRAEGLELPSEIVPIARRPEKRSWQPGD